MQYFWTIATAVFSTLALMAIGGLVSANVKELARRKGWDDWLVWVSEQLPGWVRIVIAGWQPLRQRWWLWLALGLSGGISLGLSIAPYPISRPSPPRLQWLSLFLIFLGIAALIRFFLSRRKFHLEILAPTDGSRVDLMQTVHGSTTQPNTPIQLLVLSPDNRWYPQRRVTVADRAWCAECQFGNAERGRGAQFQIVAISTAPPIKDPITSLPVNCIKSQIVHVVRSAS